MKLYTYCKSCREKFNFKIKALTRPELKDELGEYFEKECTHCRNKRTYHVNEVKAEETSNLIGNFIGLAIIIAVSLLFWNRGWITNLGLILGGCVMAASNASRFTSNAKAFNSYRIPVTPKVDN